jgi:hypothetical protein
MKSKNFVIGISIAMFFSVLPLAHLCASEAPARDDTSLLQHEIEHSRKIEGLANESAKQPFVTSNAKVLTVIAYANTDLRQPWTNEKVIYIPEGWSYSTHGVHETTGLGERKIY